MCGKIVPNWMWEYIIYCVNYLLILIQFISVITVITAITAIMAINARMANTLFPDVAVQRCLALLRSRGAHWLGALRAHILGSAYGANPLNPEEIWEVEGGRNPVSLTMTACKRPRILRAYCKPGQMNLFVAFTLAIGIDMVFRWHQENVTLL